MFIGHIVVSAVGPSCFYSSRAFSPNRKWMTAFVLGVFLEIKKYKKSLFHCRNVYRLPEILENLTFPPKFPPTPNFPRSCVLKNALFNIYKLWFISILIIWKMEQNKRSNEKQTNDSPRASGKNTLQASVANWRTQHETNLIEVENS